MRKKLILGVALTMAMASVALANTIKIYQTPDAHFLDGGEFTAYTTPPAILGLPSPANMPKDGFQTFCIESGLPIKSATTYNYVESQTDHGGNPLTLGTAWLFDQFSMGTLAGYDYTLGAGRDTSAGLLQAALWVMQGQPVLSGFPNGGVGNVFYDEAVAGLALDGYADPFAASAGAYGTVILELTDRTGADVQDLLGHHSPGIPDGGATLALLGFVLVGVEGLRRRLAR